MFQEFLKQLDIAARTLVMYSETHPRGQTVLQETYSGLCRSLEGHENLTMTVLENIILVEDKRIEEKHSAFEHLAKQLSKRGVHSLTFLNGVQQEELASLIRVINLTPQQINELGGVERMLEDRHIQHIWINKVKYGVITDEGSGLATTDELLLAQLLMTVQNAMSGSTDVSAAATGMEETLKEKAEPDRANLLFKAFVQIARTSPDHSEEESVKPVKDRFLEMFRSFTPKMQGKLLLAAALNTSLRTNHPLKEIQRELKPEELESTILTMLEEPLSGESGVHDFLASLHKDSTLSLTNTVKKKMEDLGIIPKEIAMSGPTYWERLSLRLTPDEIEKVPDALAQMIASGSLDDADKLSKKMFTYMASGDVDQKLATIKILPSMIAALRQIEKWKNLELSTTFLVSSCLRKESHPAVLEGLLRYILTSFRKNFETRNFVTCSDYNNTLQNQIASHPQWVDELIKQLPMLAPAFSHETREALEGTQSAMDYLKLCGQSGVDFILNLLANEQSQRVRGRLINHIQHFNQYHVVPQIEKRMTDERWYVVRNMITLIGKLHVSERVNFFKQAAWHPDARISKEIVKSLYKYATPADAPVVLQLLQHSDKSVRVQAGHLAAKLQLHESVPHLLHMARHPDLADSEMRTVALQVLLKLRSYDAVPIATRILETRISTKAEMQERSAAIKILGELNQEGSQKLIQKLATTDPVPELRSLAQSFILAEPPALPT